jgi:hypothetical protein
VASHAAVGSVVPLSVALEVVAAGALGVVVAVAVAVAVAEVVYEKV